MLTRRAMLGQVGAAASTAWAMRAGVAVGAGGRTAVDFEVPRGACDCHVHVFGDPATFPFAEKRIYTPPQASIEQLLELQRELRLERVVVVQPSVYGADNAAGVRRCRITTRWITDADDMAGVMDRAECSCGCYVNIRDVLAQAVKEAEERPLRAVIIVGDAFHDDPDGLDEAAISANRLRRAGTRVFLMQLGDDLITARKLQYLARVSGGAYFRFDPRTQERQFSEMWKAVSVYAAGGEEAVKITGGQAATLLLQHLKQEPMPIIEKRARVRGERKEAGNRREDGEA